MTPPRSPARDVVVIGASLSGLFAAAAAAEAGCSVTVLERDHLGKTLESRRGVPQGQQVHVLLHRGLLAAEQLVPGLEQAMVDAGAVRVDTGELPWFGPQGWQPTHSSYDVLSLTRPLLEHLVRQRVLSRPNVALVEGVRVQALRRDGTGWSLTGPAGHNLRADVVVDASGRGSRMPHWLSELGCEVPEPETVDARLGYACQLYRRPDGAAMATGLVLQSRPDLPRGGLGLPVEGGGWLVGTSGYGVDRPGRDTDLRAFAATLRDPALADVLAELEPAGAVAVHRQTGNRRYRYGRCADWPTGLLVVGDALCAFNPIYGQGITVGACQALILKDALRRTPLRTRSLQRRLGAAADFPWAVATGEDRHYLADGETPLPLRLRMADAWVAQVGLLLIEGDQRAAASLGSVYHLMRSPLALFHPSLVLAVARRLARRSTSSALPRPPAVAELTRTPQPDR